jgi:hypothetical protein
MDRAGKLFLGVTKKQQAGMFDRALGMQERTGEQREPKKAPHSYDSEHGSDLSGCPVLPATLPHGQPYPSGGWREISGGPEQRQGRKTMAKRSPPLTRVSIFLVNRDL